MVNAKLQSSYFGQDGLVLIPQGSVNGYNFFENHTIVLVHVSFISGFLPITIPFSGLFHYKSGVPSIAGVVKFVGQFKGYAISKKKARTLFNFLVRVGEGLSMNRCCNMYDGQESTFPRCWIMASKCNIFDGGRSEKTINTLPRNNHQPLYSYKHLSVYP